MEGITHDQTHQAGEVPRQYWELPYHEDTRCPYSYEQLYGPVLNKNGEPVVRANGEVLKQNDAFCMDYWVRGRDTREERFWRLRHYVLHVNPEKLKYVQNMLWERYNKNRSMLTRKQMKTLQRILSARR